MTTQVRAFTSRFPGLSVVLANQVRVVEAYGFNDPIPVAQAKEFTALWDTGATNSVITQRVVDECLLKPTGMTTVYHAQGNDRAETYLVAILLPNFVAFPQVRVTKGRLKDFDVLIGMDIITTGDFAVTNSNGATMFSFRSPSLEHIDFVKPGQVRAAAPNVGRNQLCPCGSGKKYKRCHGA